MLHLTTEERTTLVCTADPDIKMKRGQKTKPYRLLPIGDVVVNGGYPLTFVVRTLNSYEQMEVATEINENPGHANSMLSALKHAVVEVRGETKEGSGEKFAEADPEKVIEILKRVPSSVLSLLSLWITEKSWGSDPLVGKK